MIFEIELDHNSCVVAALKYGQSDHIVDTCLVSEDGINFGTSSSFVLLFSKQLRSIKKSLATCCEDFPDKIYLPVHSTILRCLILFLTQGEFFSSCNSVIQGVYEAAQLLGIEQTDLSPLNRECENFPDLFIKQEDHSKDILLPSFEVKSNVKIEENGTRKIYSLACPMCSKKFQSFPFLKQHYRRVHTEDDSFTCGYCNMKNSSKFSLQFHLSSCKSFKCSFEKSCIECCETFAGSCETEIDSKLEAHAKLFHADHQEFLLCNICYKSYNNDRLYAKHYRETHFHSANVYECPKLDCYQRFSKKSSLINHEQVHSLSGTKMFKCSFPGCDRKFKRQNSCNYHERCHKAENFKFRCKKCEYKTLNKSKLLLHQEVHSPWRKCGYCGKTLPSRNSYYTHIQRCSNKFRFKCNKCDKQFTTNQKLKRHSVKHTTEMPYVCDRCGKKFKWVRSFQTHVKEVVCNK